MDDIKNPVPMKVLNISTIIPLEGLKRENDIILRIQDYLKKHYGYEFNLAISLPFVNNALAKLKNKWRIYKYYQKKEIADVEGYKSLIFPWISPPSSNFYLNYLFVPFNYFFYKISLEKKFINYISSFDSSLDLIIAQNTIPDAIIAYMLGKKYSVPYILNVRGNFKKAVINVPFLKKVFKNAKAVITHSPVNFKKLDGRIEIKLLLHPVDPIFFNKNNHDYNIIKLVSVCRILSMKNLNWVITALAALNNKEFNFEYHIIGDGPELGSLRELTKKNNLQNKIIFHGYQNKEFIKKTLDISHVFIMPSYPETLGRAFLEAAASNCLIIGHKNTGVDGLFEHGKSAIFVDKKTIFYELDSLFDNFSHLYLRSYCDQAEHIVKNLTWEKIGEKYECLFRNVIDSKII